MTAEGGCKRRSTLLGNSFFFRRPILFLSFVVALAAGAFRGTLPNFLHLSIYENKKHAYSFKTLFTLKQSLECRLAIELLDINFFLTVLKRYDYT